jgi:CRP/FNR family transcriptional regulator, cyclic AMP receptor protein
VQAGNVDIFKVLDGDEVLLGSVGQGGVFGEMALIDEVPRMAAARATEMTTLIIVNKRMFEEKLNKTDPFIRRLLEILVENVRSASR